ncbi:hypothetical protein NP233_g4523 [Leucocoprinus birnbaumii]|uniref:DNA recombination and repair protein Rad51-like C-terminal domain-containing protein n=1 Tax=Leucocoprinus birnbaumii TaxID=56174 RepID=A0AAD5VUJ4_9AGAR|nr:hypothetical protein NP233_g4523 [Leucocoprinus birnbaumii]
MSEPPSAASLFRDIQAQSLPQLLTSVLYDTSALGSTFIPTLDEHLNPTRPMSACKRGDVIEVQGQAASGKSHMLYYLLINCVLPPSFGSVKLNGWGKAAVLLDTDLKFDVQRFGQLLRSRVQRLITLDSANVEDLITTALDRLHVFQPTSSHQLAATVQHLPKYLATNLPEADLGILAVDSITAFYWSDRYLLEQSRPGNSSNASSTRAKKPLNHVFAALKYLAQSHGPLILLSSWDLSPPSSVQTRRRLDPLVAQSNASNLAEDVLPISHHINLTASSVTTGEGGALVIDTEIDTSLTSTTCLSGTVRTPGNPQATKFTLHVTKTDLIAP